jgi:outer membrane protein OmpA-like peptidoglycan-associated protein
VEGHTDDSGEREENLRVSLARAQAVKDYLVGQGISSDRIRTIGLGERYPIASNDTRSGRQRNRRIELVLHRTGASSEQKARRP